MGIIINQAKSKPIENEDVWSYPIEEIDYLLETADDQSRFLLWEGRLYEDK